MRLFIFNSKINIIIIVFICFLAVAGVELFYNKMGVPLDHGKLEVSKLNIFKEQNHKKSKTILILGDSRAKLGVSPESLESVLIGYEIYNLSLAGANVFDQLNYISNIPCQSAIVCVSPANLFGSFVDTSINTLDQNREVSKSHFDNFLSKVNIPLHPFKPVENILSKLLSDRFKFTYGFLGISELLLYGQVSNYTTSKGWSSNIRLGSEEYYSKIANLKAYDQSLLKNNNNPEILSKLRLKFEKLISEYSKNTFIVLVRLPTSNDIYKIEEKKYEWFDEYIDSVAEKYKLPYLKNIDSFNYPEKYSDGSHLPREYAIAYSKSLGKYIQHYLSKRFGNF